MFGPLVNILCVNLGSLNVPLHPLVKPDFLEANIFGQNSFEYSCCMVPMQSYEGVTMVTAMCIRTATKTTDVNWRKIKEEDYAVNHYKAKQFKLLNPTGADLAKPSPIPDYKN
ncbi:uncharacterized protein LOC111714087 isoform X2 [Eurytemora carolleeae]|uniref:uncharacterized protein LOC111714087 isoform X2 n=1 Tax=Eurytemora carolleeae TaxID=1294199 RepID=UPI000C78F6BB|nr:uncharacterized protein LOC111714087 isoform X2 [Eurytemora carolleeae]|eukprot:XP_023344891.1 uncharacterized protein LOC111714087 isoform X2 [Eurytemora affinis]